MHSIYLAIFLSFYLYLSIYLPFCQLVFDSAAVCPFRVAVRPWTDCVGWTDFVATPTLQQVPLPSSPGQDGSAHCDITGGANGLSFAEWLPVVH